MTHQLHPLCTLFPRMTGAEFDKTFAQRFPGIHARVRRGMEARKLYSHWNYVVRFENDRVKIGSTRDPRKRVSYYLQEAARHGLGEVWFSSWGGMQKFEALWIERSIIQAMSADRIAGHREWFLGGVDACFEAEKLFLDLQMHVIRENRTPDRPFGISYSLTPYWSACNGVYTSTQEDDE